MNKQRLFRQVPHSSGEGMVISKFDLFCRRRLRVRKGEGWRVYTSVPCDVCGKKVYNASIGKVNTTCSMECFEAWLGVTVGE